VHATPLTPQGVFLERLGITARAETLAGGLTGAARAAHVAAHRRLTHPDEMGKVFQVRALVPAGAGPTPGFAG
jgi:SAM-dependent MidA family methyltransferase